MKQKSQTSPLEHLPKTSKALGVPIWVKREDRYNSGGVSGSKGRKLQRILPMALAKNATDIVTAGSTGSHHIQAVTLAGKAAGLRVHAVVLRQPPLPYADRIFESIQKLKPELHFTSNHTALALRMALLYWKLKHQARTPFVISPGASYPGGIHAYAHAGLELAHDIEKLGHNFDIQICGFGTGGITAGLQAAAQIKQSLPPVLAVQLYPGFWNRKYFIKRLARLAGKEFRGGSYDEHGLKITKDYLGAGYGTHNPHCDEAVTLFKKDGIFLDPIYMARVGQAVIDWARRNPSARGIVFWYTAPATPYAP